MTAQMAEAHRQELCRLRQLCHWSQQDMATQLGIRQDSVSRYERGIRQIPEPTIRLIRHLAAARLVTLTQEQER